MPNYRDAGAEVHHLIESIVADHYPDLAEAEVTFDALFAWSDKGLEPCLTQGGRPVALKIRVVPHKERVKGASDVEISIDANPWGTWDAEKQAAALDGVLAYLEVQRDDEGVIKEDKGNRPRLKLQQADFLLEGFAAVAERHGEASLEVSTAKRIVDRFGQQLFPFADLKA